MVSRAAFSLETKEGRTGRSREVELELINPSSLWFRSPAAIEARKAVKEATDHASLEVKYMDLVRFLLQAR